MAPVGSAPAGAARWGHLDLAGSMFEWVLDVFDAYPAGAGQDYAKSDDVPLRGIRGGAWRFGVQFLRGADRGASAAASRASMTGFRCAR
jgi:formylglycine-generating enzyme required for sulfatase activity